MEAKDSKGNVIKAGDTVKVLRKWGEGESELSPNFAVLDTMIGNSYSIKSIDFKAEEAYLSNSKIIPLCVLEKVQATEMFKVLITGCFNEEAWYADKIGDKIDASELDKDRFHVDPHTYIKKSDCHVIEPTWKVMKDAEETGREVEVWGSQTKEWLQKGASTVWFSDFIYRLAPEPAQPEYEPYSYEDADKLRGLWVRRKGEKGEEMITAIGPYRIGTSERLCPSYSELFEKYETLDGQPVGKLKTT